MNRTPQRRVVIADDSDDHALLIQIALERAAGKGVEVVRARDGDEAVDRVREHRPDLLLLDLRMPGRDGHEVLEELKADPALRRIPVAVLTSSDRDEDLARSYGLGGNHFLTKPDNPAVLEEQLRRLLRNLDELGAVKRGRGTIDSTGQTADDPLSLAVRRTIPWLTAVVVLAILAGFAWVLGLV